MARVELVPEVLDDFHRFVDDIAPSQVEDASARVRAIVEAVGILTHSPLIGRPVRGGKRELVIGHGAQGYVALYRFAVRMDTVFVLAIRGQRQAGHTREYQAYTNSPLR